MTSYTLYKCMKLTFCFWHALLSVLRIRDVYPGSRILIFTHPGFRISDPESQNINKREGWKKNCCHSFLCSHKFHKIVNYFGFEMLKKKKLDQFSKNYITFYSLSSQKYGFGIRDPGSEIRDPEKTYSGSRIQWSNRHRIPDADPQHWLL